ncbi:hypothetical protein GIB67_028704 [Kingdonia uniflora]|uniref:RNase H type-1 domain-containing protein n=1 Tax=Kingdonia uniflora TaxID=39325 RepID=A0A7J7NAF3_9MAGN|nr:hypothetical protein GIB67_028704 [Kingdonia uniflora]
MDIYGNFPPAVWTEMEEGQFVFETIYEGASVNFCESCYRMGHRIYGCTISIEEDSSGIGARIQTLEDSLSQDTAAEKGMPERNPCRPTPVYLGPTESGERGVNIANTRYSRKAKGKDLVGPGTLWPPFTRRADLPGFEDFLDPVQGGLMGGPMFRWTEEGEEDTLAGLVGGRHTCQLFFEEERLTLQVFIPQEGKADELKWSPSKDGKFLIKSAYRVILAARISSCRFMSSEQGEALAVLGGVKWAREQGLTRVNVETDVEAIISFCQTGAASISWSSKAILHDALALYKHFEDICISYTPRSANSVAHIIAGRPTNGNLCFPWFGSPPEWPQESLRSDGTTFVTLPI